MSDPKLDQQLAEYLEQVASERRRGITNEAIMRAVQNLAAARLRDYQRINALEQGHTRHGRRIGTIERKLEEVTRATPAVPDWQPDPSEITGTHQFQTVMAAHKAATKAEELEERLDEEKQDRTFWKRQGVIWAVGAFGFVMAMILTACSTIAMTRLFSPPASPPPVFSPLPAPSNTTK